MAELAIKMTGEEADVFAAMQKVIAKANETGAAFQKASDKSKRASEETKALLRAEQQRANSGKKLAGELARANESLTQKYTRQRQELLNAYGSGKIGADQYKQAINQLNERYKQLDNSRERAVGSGAMDQVKNYAASFLSIAGAVNVVRRALEFYNEEREKATGQTNQLEDIRMRLRQISKGDFDQLERRSDSAASLYGTTREKARSVMFAARSEGFEQDYEQVMQASPIIDAEAAGRVAGQVRGLFGNKFSTRESLNAVLQGARDSRLSFEELTAGMPMVGEGGAQQGASFEESVATLSVLASDFKSGRTAGNRIKALLTKMAIDPKKMGTSGKGLIGGVEHLQSLSDEDRADFLGESQEVNSAYTIITKRMGLIKQRQADVASAIANTGTDQGLITAGLQETYNAGTKSGRRALSRVNANRQEVLEQTRLESEMSEQEFMNQAHIRMRQANESTSVGRFVVGAVGGSLNAMGYDLYDEAGAAGVGPGRSGAQHKLMGELIHENKKTNEKFDKLIDKITGSGDSLSKPGSDK